MRTWLIRHKGQFFALVIAVVIGTAFALGWYVGSNATDRHI